MQYLSMQRETQRVCYGSVALEAVRPVRSVQHSWGRNIRGRGYMNDVVQCFLMHV